MDVFINKYISADFWKQGETKLLSWMWFRRSLGLAALPPHGQGLGHAAVHSPCWLLAPGPRVSPGTSHSQELKTSSRPLRTPGEGCNILRIFWEWKQIRSGCKSQLYKLQSRLDFAGLDPASAEVLSEAGGSMGCVCVCFTSPLGEQERDLREESDRV